MKEKTRDDIFVNEQTGELNLINVKGATITIETSPDNLKRIKEALKKAKPGTYVR